MQLQCLIIDDELPAQKVLTSMLAENCPSVTVKAIVSSSSEAREILNRQTFDLLFLDVNMPNESGFDLLNTINASDYAIIFVTGSSEYALKALKASAVDFLLKPVDIEELKIAVDKANAILQLRKKNKEINAGYISSINNLADQLKQQKPITKLTLHHLQGFKILSINDIIYLEAEGNYTIFHTQNDKIIVSKGMGLYESLLDEQIFFRTHKSFIINLNYLKEYSTQDGYNAIMQNGASVMIGRRRVEEFLERVKRISFMQ